MPQLMYMLGCAIARAVRCGLPTAAARVRSRFRACGICGGRSGLGAGCLRVLRFPLTILIPPSHYLQIGCTFHNTFGHPWAVPPRGSLIIKLSAGWQRTSSKTQRRHLSADPSDLPSFREVRVQSRQEILTATLRCLFSLSPAGEIGIMWLSRPAFSTGVQQAANLVWEAVTAVVMKRMCVRVLCL
jgi:hypothetical protein